ATRFALARALEMLSSWPSPSSSPWVSINLATRCLHWDGLPEMVAESLAAAGVEARWLVVELPDAGPLNLDQAGGCLKALRELGVGVALDNFGTGHGSLSRLRSLPMSIVKIDRSFVASVARSEPDRAIVRTISGLATELGITPMAEGVETADQLEALQRLG